MIAVRSKVDRLLALTNLVSTKPSRTLLYLNIIERNRESSPAWATNLEIPCRILRQQESPSTAVTQPITPFTSSFYKPFHLSDTTLLFLT